MKIQDALDLVPEIIAGCRRSCHEDAIRKIVSTMENYRRMNKELRRELNKWQKQTKQ